MSWRRVFVLFARGWPVEWTAAVVDATPRYCIRCESKVTAIRLVPLPLADQYVVRCGHCNYSLIRVAKELVSGDLPRHRPGNLALPPPGRTDIPPRSAQ